MSILHFQEWMAGHGVSTDDVHVVGKAILPEYRLRTNYLRGTAVGAANIEPHRGSRVEGVAYRITPEAWRALRRKEGWPVRYAEVIVPVRLVRQGRYVSALTYVVTPEHRLTRNIPVSPAYRQLILDGAASHGLTLKYRSFLHRLLRTSPGGQWRTEWHQIGVHA